jgi:hypothetical protein
MRFLASAMDDVTLHLLSGDGRSKNIGLAIDPFSDESRTYDKMILCKAVEERICRKIDLASRTDLSLQQATNALRLLLKIVQQNDLSIDISSAEKLLLSCSSSFQD